MNHRKLRHAVLVAVSLAVLSGIALAAQDKYSVKVTDGLGFSEFRGYESWETVASSETKTSVKSILANPVMIKAYQDGIPGNGKPFPEGSKIVKIEWLKKVNPLSPYFVEVPDTLRTVNFIEKDSKRFPDTQGWAYASFSYDTATDTLKPSELPAPLSSTGTKCGFACHTIVKSNDYIFTAYPKR
jgi:hypothetical protein